MVLARDTLTRDDDHFIFKSHGTGRSYVPGRILEHTKENSHSHAGTSARTHTQRCKTLYAPRHFMAGHTKLSLFVKCGKGVEV